MSEYNNSMDIMDDGMTFETPAHAGRTLKRLWRFVNDQHKRLTIVLVSVVFYTFLSIIAPAYSAHHGWYRVSRDMGGWRQRYFLPAADLSGDSTLLYAASISDVQLC